MIRINYDELHTVFKIYMGEKKRSEEEGADNCKLKGKFKIKQRIIVREKRCLYICKSTL
jgi:hypothetical protein